MKVLQEPILRTVLDDGKTVFRGGYQGAFQLEKTTFSTSDQPLFCDFCDGVSSQDSHQGQDTPTSLEQQNTETAYFSLTD